MVFADSGKPEDRRCIGWSASTPISRGFELLELMINQPFRLAETQACGQGHRWLTREDGWHEAVVRAEPGVHQLIRRGSAEDLTSPPLPGVQSNRLRLLATN